MTAVWERLKASTRARIGLGRAGDGLPTAEILAFRMAHAMARDAVHASVDFGALAAELRPIETIMAKSAARNRAEYLKRPDLGRRLADGVAGRLPKGRFEIVFIIGDGLSATAVERHAPATLREAMARLGGMSIGPVVLAAEARVALGDEIGAAMGARLAVMLIGERPGLTAADSLGIYLTFAPAPGRRDSERNCISNIHDAGLSPAIAAAKLVWLIRQSLRLQLSGVELKDETDGLSLPVPEARPEP